MFAEKRAVLFVAENVDISFMQYHLLFLGWKLAMSLKTQRKEIALVGLVEKPIN